VKEPKRIALNVYPTVIAPSTEEVEINGHVFYRASEFDRIVRNAFSVKASKKTMGQRIVDEIIKGRMLHIVDGNIFVWSANAYEQLDALIAEYIKEKEVAK